MQQATEVKIISVILIFGGVLLIINPSWYSFSYHMQIDFSGFEWPIGGIMVLTGCVLLWTVMKDNMQFLKGKSTKILSASVAFLIATIAAKIVFIPSIFLVFIQKNFELPNYIQGIVLFCSLALAIWVAILTFKAVYARMLIMTKDV